MDRKTREHAVGIKLMYKEVIDGLSKDKKELSSKYFYDERGSQLFDEICSLEEYYVTRTELKIMRRNIDEIAARMGKSVQLIEYGSGSSEKIRILLDNIPEIKSYVPIDISCEFLAKSAARIAESYPGLQVAPVCADYSSSFEIPDAEQEIAQKVIYFPGSTIGNFHRTQAIAFLQNIVRVGGKNSALLIGVDLKKDEEILNRAYNDSKGVTAAFNLNQLAHFNRALGSDFDLQNFEHDAFYNRDVGRIEMHIRSRREQDVHVNGNVVHFEAGESIWTESSYKYSLPEFAALAAEAGYSVEKVWTDAENLFSVQYLKAL